MRILPILLALMACTGPDQAPGDTPIPPKTPAADSNRALEQHLDTHAQKPLDYLVAKVKAHPVVLLGEIHQVRSTCRFVADSLPALYHRGGLRCLATEFLRSAFTEEANKLLAADKWPEKEFIDLMRRGPWPTWGFREYLDIYRAIWRLNRSLPQRAQPLYLQGMDSDWSQHWLWFGKPSRAERMKMLMGREETMTAAVERGGIKAGRRTLVHVGFAHSVLNHGIRLGTVLRKRHGDKIFQVAMHQKFFARASGPGGKTPPFYQRIEKLCLPRGPLGFDVKDSPFAALKDGNSPRHSMPSMPLGSLAQGYIILKAAGQNRNCTWIKGFINPATFAEANRTAIKMKWVDKGQCGDAAALDASLRARFADKPPAKTRPATEGKTEQTP